MLRKGYQVLYIDSTVALSSIDPTRSNRGDPCEEDHKTTITVVRDGKKQHSCGEGGSIANLWSPPIPPQASLRKKFCVQESFHSATPDISAFDARVAFVYTKNEIGNPTQR